MNWKKVTILKVTPCVIVLMYCTFVCSLCVDKIRLTFIVDLFDLRWQDKWVIKVTNIRSRLKSCLPAIAEIIRYQYTSCTFLFV